MRPHNNRGGSEFDAGAQARIANLAVKFFIAVIVATVVLLVIIKSVSVFQMVFQTFEGSDLGEEPIGSIRKFSLNEVASDYMKNEVRADAKYEHPFITIVRVRRIDGNGFLELSGGGRNHIEAYFKNKDDLLQLDIGDSVTLHCQSADGSSDSLGAFVYLRKCSLYSTGEN